jgi:L-lactate dehydrogenase complex protein LldF
MKEGHGGFAKKSAMKTMAAVLSNSGLYRLSGKMGRIFMGWFPALINNKLNPWSKQRDMPAPPKQSFNEWYKNNRKNG